MSCLQVYLDDIKAEIVYAAHNLFLAKPILM
jgi:hypothetical protein